MHRPSIRLTSILAAVALALPLAAHAFNVVEAGKLVLQRVQSGSSVATAPAQVPVLQRQSGAGFGACESMFPGGAKPVIPGAQKLQLRSLCFDGFAVIHSGATKTPMVSVEVLSRTRLNDALDEARSDLFFADERLPASERAELSDYAGSGYDRGHVAPAADMPDARSMAQSFALSNMVPQDPHNNRKVWSKIESDVRKYVRRAPGRVYVFSGPLFSASPRTIGRGVHVPSHLYKLVYDESSSRAWAYVLANSADARIERPVDYARFVQMTGLQLLPGVPLAQ